MQLATLLRDSDGSLVRRSVGGSEWTAAGWPSLAPVALLVVVCQQLPAVHYTARWKVGTRFAGCCYRLRCSSACAGRGERCNSAIGRAGVLLLSRSRWEPTACSAHLPVKRGTVNAHLAPWLLAAKWLYPTRLETRTKESNMCASLGVTETQRRNESKGCLAAEVRSLLHASEAHHRPTCSTLRRV